MLAESFNRMKLRAEGAASDETLAEGAVLAESFNRMKLRAEGAASDETLAEGAVLAESFNRMKLWLKVWRWLKVSTG